MAAYILCPSIGLIATVIDQAAAPCTIVADRSDDAVVGVELLNMPHTHTPLRPRNHASLSASSCSTGTGNLSSQNPRSFLLTLSHCGLLVAIIDQAAAPCGTAADMRSGKAGSSMCVELPCTPCTHKHQGPTYRFPMPCHLFHLVAPSLATLSSQSLHGCQLTLSYWGT